MLLLCLSASSATRCPEDWTASPSASNFWSVSSSRVSSSFSPPSSFSCDARQKRRTMIKVTSQMTAETMWRRRRCQDGLNDCLTFHRPVLKSSEPARYPDPLAHRDGSLRPHKLTHQQVGLVTLASCGRRGDPEQHSARATVAARGNVTFRLDSRQLDRVFFVLAFVGNTMFLVSLHLSFLY